MTVGFIASDRVPFLFQTGVRSPMRFAIVMALVTLAVGVAMVWVLFRGRPASMGVERVVIAVSVGAVAGLASVPALVRAIDLDPFGFIQLGWNCIVFVLAPTALLRLIRKSLRRRLATGASTLADLQTDRITPFEHPVVDRLLAEKPAPVLIPGHLFQGGAREFNQELPAFNGLLRRLDAPVGVYFTCCTAGRSASVGESEWSELKRRASASSVPPRSQF